MDDVELAVQVISGSGSLALACHMLPDGDALGSMLALHHLCRAQGKPSVASWPEPFVVGPHYTYLPGLDLVTKPVDFPSAPEVMVTFDCGSLGRLGELATPAEAAEQLVVIDHHATNDRYGSVNVVDPDAAASAVLVYRLARRLGWPLTREAAICLYTGIVTDTGRFQYSNTTPEVFAMADELARYDLPIAAMTRQLFEEHRFTYLKLVALALERAELDSEHRFVATWITAADLERFGVELEETEGLIDLVRRAAEADVSCVLKETAEGTRVSLRAVDDTDVSAIATTFGGGGHRAAAGFTSDLPIAEVLEAIRAALPAR
jgi:bifunctional oligoribonuclease and PAP phosphatase NrnA